MTTKTKPRTRCSSCGAHLATEDLATLWGCLSKPARAHVLSPELCREYLNDPLGTVFYSAAVDSPTVEFCHLCPTTSMGYENLLLWNALVAYGISTTAPRPINNDALFTNTNVLRRDGSPCRCNRCSGERL